MKKLNLLTVLILLSCMSVFSQSVYKNTRDLKNSYYNQTGSETITMKKTETFDVKDGAYIVKINILQPSGGTESISITGAFKNDKPDGQWIYQLTQTNFETPGNRYYNTNIKLIQNWKSGAPDGNWIYDYNKKYRHGTGSKRLGTFKYGNFQDPDTKYKSINYKDGLLDGEFISGPTKQSLTFKCTYKNNYITYMWYGDIHHEFKFGDRGYATSVVEQHSASWDHDFYIEYSSEDMEIINKLNAGMKPEDMELDVYQDMKVFETETPYELFGQDFILQQYNLTNSLDFNRIQRNKKLPPYIIYKWNSNKVYKE